MACENLGFVPEKSDTEKLSENLIKIENFCKKKLYHDYMRLNHHDFKDKFCEQRNQKKCVEKLKKKIMKTNSIANRQR